MKKKFTAIILAAATALTLAGCGSKPAEETETVVETSEQTEVQTEQTVNMANPWTEASTMDEAAEGAGVGSLILTEDGTETAAGMLNWYGYRYMDGIAEVEGGIGTATITVRKGLASLGDISGDYTAYAYTWDMEVDDIDVTCSGNEEGQAMLFTWSTGDYNYSVMVRGQGDLYETYGLASDTVTPLVSEWIS